MAGQAKGTNDIVVRLRMELMGLKQKVAKAKKQMRQLSGAALQSKMKSTAQTMGKVEKKTTQLNKAMGKWQPQFAGYALSLMFFGMALQRMFMRISKSAISTFQEISHQAGVSSTATDILQGSFKYLGFVIGQALQPVLQWLIPIVEKFTTWASENQSLAASLLVITGVLGTLLMVGGMLKLAIDGFVGAWAILPATATGALGSVKAAIMSFIGVLSGPLLAIIGVLVLAWMTNFGKFKDFIKSTFDVVWEVIKGVFAGLKDIFLGVWKVIKGIFTGDFEKVWDGVVQILEGAITIIKSLLVGLVAVIGNVLMWIWNSVVAMITNSITLVLGAVKKAIEGANELLPDKWKIGTGGLDRAIQKVRDVKDSIQADYFTGDDVRQAVFGPEDSGLSGDKESRVQKQVNQTMNFYVDGNMDSDTADRIVDGINETNPGGA